MSASSSRYVYRPPGLESGGAKGGAATAFRFAPPSYGGGAAVTWGVKLLELWRTHPVAVTAGLIIFALGALYGIADALFDLSTYAPTIDTRHGALPTLFPDNTVPSPCAYLTAKTLGAELSCNGPRHMRVGGNFAVHTRPSWAQLGDVHCSDFGGVESTHKNAAGEIVPRKTYYATVVGNNLRTLDILLHEIYEVVDVIILIESTVDYEGRAKPLYFERSKIELFSRFMPKIRHIIVDDGYASSILMGEEFEQYAKGKRAAPLEEAEPMGDMHMSTFQKIADGLWDVHPDDLVFTAPEDQVPSSAFMSAAKVCDIGLGQAVETFPVMTAYKYSFKCTGAEPYAKMVYSDAAFHIHIASTQVMEHGPAISRWHPVVFQIDKTEIDQSKTIAASGKYPTGWYMQSFDVLPKTASICGFDDSLTKQASYSPGSLPWYVEANQEIFWDIL